MDYKVNDIVIFRGDKVVAVVKGVENMRFCDPADEAARSKAWDEAAKLAVEFRGLPYEVRSNRWLESTLHDFVCRMESDTEVSVETPIGKFYLEAVPADPTCRNYTSSPLVSITGRLNAPRPGIQAGWDFQPSHFGYESGESSPYLGSYPRKIRWENQPDWPLDG